MNLRQHLRNNQGKLTDAQIAKKSQLFDVRPKAIEDRLKLRNLFIWKPLHMDIWAEHPAQLPKLSGGAPEEP